MQTNNNKESLNSEDKLTLHDFLRRERKESLRRFLSILTAIVGIVGGTVYFITTQTIKYQEGIIREKIEQAVNTRSEILRTQMDAIAALSTEAILAIGRAQSNAQDLEELVNKATEKVTSAEEAATGASSAKDKAETAAQTAQDEKVKVEKAAIAAENSKLEAQEAATGASLAKDKAETAAQTAQDKR